MTKGLMKNKWIPTLSEKKQPLCFFKLVSVTNAKKNKCLEVTMTVALPTSAQQTIPVQEHLGQA